MKAIKVKELREYLNSLDSIVDDYTVVVSDEICTEAGVVGVYEDHNDFKFTLDILGRIER